MCRFLGVLIATLLVVGATPTIAAGPTPSREGGPGLNHDLWVVRGYFHDHPMRRGEFGGIYFVQGKPDTLHVMIVDDPLDRPYPWEADIANPDQLRIHRAEFSYRYLKHIQRRVTRTAEKGEQSWAKRICGVGVYEDRNVVHIVSYTGRAPVGFWDHWAGEFPRRAVTFEKGCPAEGVGGA